MHIAFYAPMKPPDHPVPSGDRRMAELLLRALRHAGHRVTVASRLRSYDGTGDAARQRRIGETAARVARRTVARHRTAPPDLWFTYHCYHKAPDLLGPAVADAFGIPLVIADASVAPKRADGPWAGGYAAANAAIRRADRLIAFDPLDIPCLRALRNGADGIVMLAPFVDRAPPEAGDRAAARRALARAFGLDPARPWLAATAMMRPGAKLDSYKLLARALARLADRRWTLLVAGDGPARPEVERLFAGNPAARFLGALDEDGVRRLHLGSDLAVWPAVDEGYCMALVEGLVVGLPAVAGARPGIASVIEHGATGLLTPVGDDAAFAAAVAALLDDPARRAAMRDAAAVAAGRFGLDTAVARLDAVLTDACRGARAA
jgi:glycosyltransferase involved in cell wall biosynthesis